VRKVLLFGSLARGDARDHSDIDMIVVKDTQLRFLDRLDELYDDAREAMDMRLEPKRDQDLDDAKYCFQGKRFNQGPRSSWVYSYPGVFLHLSVSSFNILRRAGL
jgi:hypothetical protein